MDSFREWISDNLRYILLGLAIIIILVVAVFAVKLISGLSDGGSTKGTESETPQSVIVESNETESDRPENNLVKDEPVVLTVVQSYYTALGNKDMDTLNEIVESLDEKDKKKILDNEYTESYNNISVYTKQGLEEGSYVTYVYFEGKVVDIETLVPSLSCLYLRTGEDGSLYIADQDSDEDIKNYIEQTKSDSDVKALIKDVSEKYAEAEANDPSLKELMDSLATPETESVLPDSSDTGVQTNKIVTAMDVLNVRADSTEDAEVIGMLDKGETVTRVKQLDNGWSEIRYGETTGYVKSEYLTESTSTQENE